MVTINIGKDSLDIDIVEELTVFSWSRDRWDSEKLIAASPFRYDHSPSFFLNLSGEYAGTWKDSGAFDTEYETGNFPKLLAFLRDETYEESVEYLYELYGERNDSNNGRVTIPSFGIHKKERRIVLHETEMKGFMYRHPYLGKRGITDRVQRFMGIGYSKQSQAVVMPWRHPDGSLANIKFRKVRDKTFWYKKGAAPVRSLVYGIDKVYKHNLKEVVVCEAEIDAMSWYTCGVPAIAVGGTSVTQSQLDLIRKSPIERILISEDNDKAGSKLGRHFRDSMRGTVEVQDVYIPEGHKDANDALVAGVNLKDLIM